MNGLSGVDYPHLGRYTLHETLVQTTHVSSLEPPDVPRRPPVSNTLSLFP